MKNWKKALVCVGLVVLLAVAALGGYALAWITVPPPEPADSFSQDGSSSAPSTPPVTKEPADDSASSAPDLPEELPEHSEYGQPDGSETKFHYAPFNRPKDWKQIVTDSPFRPGTPSKNDDDRPGTYPILDGFTFATPMAVEFARQHLALSDEDIASRLHFSAIHNFYFDLIINLHEEMRDDPVDLIIGTEPSDEDLAMAKDIGITLAFKPVCYDALVFITHKDNPIESLTIKQIQKIYTGKITNWNEVGGLDAPIIAYQREKYSGSQTAMENLVMKGKPMIDTPTVVIDAWDGERPVAEYQNHLSSLGYSYQYYIDHVFPDKAIKTIAIEGIEPNADTIRSRTYPFSTNYYGVIRAGDENKTGGKFLDWMLSPEGQACIAQAGYIPMDDMD